MRSKPGASWSSGGSARPAIRPAAGPDREPDPYAELYAAAPTLPPPRGAGDMIMGRSRRISPPPTHDHGDRAGSAQERGEQVAVSLHPGGGVRGGEDQIGRVFAGLHLIP